MKKYTLILISLLLAVLMITTVSANDNAINDEKIQTEYDELEIEEYNSENQIVGDYIAENIPIEYRELEADENDSEVMFIGTYIEYPMNKINESSIVDLSTTGLVSTNKIDERKTPRFTETIANRTTDGNATIIITGDDNITGQIYFSFLKTPLNLTNGKVSYNLTGLKRGSYSFEYYYSGNDNYKDGARPVSFTIPSTASPITVEKENTKMYYKDGTSIKIFIEDNWGTKLKNKSIYFDINDVRYRRVTDENGSASIKLNLNPGNYDIIAFYTGSVTTSGNLTHINVTILPTITSQNITKIYKNGTQYIVNAIDNKGNPLINQTVQFNVNGVHYNRTTDENGTARLNINLGQGTYVITAENLNTEDKISNTIEVLPTIISEDLIKIYKNNSQFIIKALKTDRSPLTNTNVTFNINGVFYNRTTDSNGNAKLNINLGPGRYIITTENPNDECKVSNTIIVTPYLFTQDLTKYYKNSSRFACKLFDSGYNPQANSEIIFIINQVEYKRNTNSNGEASIAINLQPGEYEITTKSSQYETTNKILILPTIIDLNEANITINSDKERKYNVTILDGNGNPFSNQTVRFRYANEKIDVQTDSNGIASFEGKRINQYNPIEIEYNGYSITNYNVQFKKYPYVPADRTENGWINLDSQIPRIITNIL